MPPKSSKTDVPVAEQAPADIATEEAAVTPAAVEQETQSAASLDAVVTARVLVAVTIGSTRYQPNDIIADLPEALANSHADALDIHPAAIELALADGGQIKHYEA